ncbi:hypothetical protein JAAARDRAFT_188912 [Jaapia argillacea MUCL 33604]|uniref:PLC-like phosphodiesterase n=1 Tax=Jaapia argillacea MUCL 33604 TaxID=933084 RepID=A0A067Q8K8_9AGAM|nr:hypothetical protein JAAARDRAFT_188912 [Jaapia argillacea MUCL 33604]
MRLSLKNLAPVALSLLSLTCAAGAASIESRATTCNGHAELCDRSFGNITFVGSHDSYAIGTNNLATNQDVSITQQLNDGIRMLQVQAHNLSGTIQLCHTSCALYNGGTLQSYLTTVKTWMDANPNDVLSLLIVNSDDLPPTAYDTVFKAAGLDTLSYAPSFSALTASQWPTLGTLISSGKRILTFMDGFADFTTVPYIIDEFTNIWETAFDVTDPTFDCNVNRSKGDTSTSMYLINHFLDQIILGQPAPYPAMANVTNGVSGPGSLGQQVQTCAATYGRNPNFMLVDFYEYGGGSVFEVAATANGVTYSPTTPIASPSSGGSSSTSTSHSTSGAIVDFGLTSGHLTASLSVVAGIVMGAWSLV